MARKWYAIRRQIFSELMLDMYCKFYLKVNQRFAVLWILPLKKGYTEQVALRKASRQTQFSFFIAVILLEFLKEPSVLFHL